MSEATGIALATNRDERRRSSLRAAVRAAVLALTLATMTLATAAWADQAPATTNSQPGPTTTIRIGPTTTTKIGPTTTTKIGPTTTTKIGPTTTKSSTIQDPLPRSIPVTATPRAAGAGTTVKVAADVRGCDLVHAFFYDRNSKGSGVDGGGSPLGRLRITDNRWLAGEYTVTRRDAVGQGRFGVLCNLHHDNYREGYASFQVKAGDSSNDSGSGDNPPAGTNNSTVQGPSSDAGLGGTARSGGGLVWLLLPAGLLLLAVAAVLRLRRAGS
jgi:hypothetical protein